MDLGELTLETAKPFEGATFDVALPDGSTVQMKLDEVADFPLRERRRSRSAVQRKREPFSLFFLGSPDYVVPQGTYTFRGPDIVLEGLFIVPVGQDAVATEYEAVFA